MLCLRIGPIKNCQKQLLGPAHGSHYGPNSDVLIVDVSVSPLLRGQCSVKPSGRRNRIRERSSAPLIFDRAADDGVGEGKSGGFSGDQQSQFHYGTFQGVANCPPPHPVQPHYDLPPPPLVIGFSQPVPPPVLTAYSYGYQNVPVAVQGYVVVAEGRPVRGRLPSCGIGFGWFLFIIGFLFGGFPWYIGTFFLLFVRVHPREKPGYVACLIGATLASITVMLGLTTYK